MKIIKLREDIPDPVSYKEALPDAYKNYPHKLDIDFQGGTVIPDLPKGDHYTICRKCQSGTLCQLALDEIDFFDNKQKLRSIKSIKYCPAVEDIHKVGYILPAWDDITIVNHEIDNINRLLAFDSKGLGIASLKFKQMDTKGMIGNLFNDYPVKFHFPYRVYTEKGYLTQILNPDWIGFNTKYTFATGILDTNVWSLINIHAFFNLQKDESIFIEKGTPLVLLQEIHHKIFQSNYEIIQYKDVDWDLLEKFDYNEHLQDINKTNYRAMQKNGLKEKPKHLK